MKILSIKGVISILIIAIVALYSLQAYTAYHNYKSGVNPSLELTPSIFKIFIKNEIKKEIIKKTAQRVMSDEQSPLKTFRLTINQQDIVALNLDLPKSGKAQYIDAYLLISDEPEKTRKVKLRYRGDNNFHWLYAQKSLRIKLAKKDNYNMEKVFNLINPPYDYTLIDNINYQISSDLGIISPDFYPARVFINGKYMGVYMYLSQVDESLLRKHKIMPGSIYYGDNAPANKQGISSLWQSAEYWKKKASRNAEQKNNREDINYFIQSINTLAPLEFYKFVNTSLDKEKYYNYFALDVIFGSEHHDYHHNHKLYFDPYKGKFEPIQWDLRFWHPYGTKDVSVYPLIEKISLNPILEHQRDQVAYKLMQSDTFKQETINAKLAKLNKVQKEDLAADTLKDRAIYSSKKLKGWHSEPYTQKDLDKTIKDKLWHFKVRQEKLNKVYQNANISYKLTKIADQTYVIELFSKGNSAVEIKAKNSTTMSLYKDLNFNGQIDANETAIDSIMLYPGRKIENKPVEHFGKFLSGNIRITPATEKYTIIIKTKTDTLDISDFVFTNKITLQPLQATIYNSDEKPQKNDSIHPWQLPQPKQKIITLQGQINVDTTLVFDRHTPVIIKPNTTFIMAENTSIYFYAKVTAKGTSEQPIKFIAKDAKKPWGIVAVQGKQTSGSLFEYCQFENGSIDVKNLIHYTAPFNLHDTDNFKVNHCKIGKNFKGDDAMHIAYAQGTVENSQFIDARSDGLDIDISNVIINNNIFSNSGNDGLDIMTTEMTATNNTFIETGDKGISVGEWSTAEINDSHFIRTWIGLEIKDKSNVNANNLRFIDTKNKAINLYRKNKRYDSGGQLQAGKLYFKGNDIITKDKKSKINITSKERISG